MQKPEPMDRLVCGDVGYGKTEVAMRAAFKATLDRKQVAVLVPTTVLAQQHFHTFRKRFADYPVTIEVVSSMRKAPEVREVLKRARDGKVDILIGTHKLLGTEVGFKDLGLLVVDEEQRFGVKHKERIKQLRTQVDVLTLTATPIPRTLHMSMSGLRDMSIIATPPAGPAGHPDLRHQVRSADDPRGDRPRAPARRAGVLRPQPRAVDPLDGAVPAASWCPRPPSAWRTGRWARGSWRRRWPTSWTGSSRSCCPPPSSRAASTSPRRTPWW